MLSHYFPPEMVPSKIQLSLSSEQLERLKDLCWWLEMPPERVFDLAINDLFSKHSRAFYYWKKTKKGELCAKNGDAGTYQDFFKQINKTYDQEKL